MYTDKVIDIYEEDYSNEVLDIYEGDYSDEIIDEDLKLEESEMPAIIAYYFNNII